MRAEFHPLARVELLEIADYIEERRTGYGRRFLDAFSRARDYLLMYPKGAPKTRGGRRKEIIRFKHDIIYRVYGDVIFIVAIAHHRRKPFWGGRRRR
jgi:plasmid stabilization system protein ParE